MSAAVDLEGYFPCKWDWCRATFASLRDAMEHVVVQHINTAPLLTPAEIRRAQRLEADHPFSLSEESWLASTPRPSQLVHAPMSTQQTLSTQSQPILSQPLLLSPPRLLDTLSKANVQAEHFRAPSSSGSPTPPPPRAAHAPLVAYSSRASSPSSPPPPLPDTASSPPPTKPIPSFAALSGGTSVLTPPLKRLPASPTSEEQIYRHLAPNNLHVDESDSSKSSVTVSGLGRKRKAVDPPVPSTPKQRARKGKSGTATPGSVVGTPRRSSRHGTAQAETPKPKGKATATLKATPKATPKPTPKSTPKQTPIPRKRRKVLSDDDDEEEAEDGEVNLPAIREMEEGEIASSSPVQERSQDQTQSQAQAQSQEQEQELEQTEDQSQPETQSQSQWRSQPETQDLSQWQPETQTQSLNLATQMPLSQDSFEWAASQ